jgi:hypothetical protein
MVDEPMSRDFIRINERIDELIFKGLVNAHIGKAKPSIPIKIEGVNAHARTHGITLEQAQSYVDMSEIMFDQDSRTMYLSNDGSATVLIENNRLISAYGRKDFDSAIMAILEVLDNE